MDMTLQRKTDAKITTNIALRESARTIKARLNEDLFDNNFINSLTGKKKSITKLFQIVEDFVDRCCQGTVIAKNVLPNKRRTSKDKTVEWLVLDYDEEKPFARREEHLIHVSYLLANTKHMADTKDIPTGIYITKHILERIALRKNVSSLQDICKEMVVPIKALFIQKPLLRDCADKSNEGFVLITKDAYFILDGVDEPENKYDVMLKTMLPINDWSKTKQKKLNPIVNNLKEGEVALIRVEDFNSDENLIKEERIRTINEKENSQGFAEFLLKRTKNNC